MKVGLPDRSARVVTARGSWEVETGLPSAFGIFVRECRHLHVGEADLIVSRLSTVALIRHAMAKR